MTVFCCVVFSRETTTMQLYSISLCLLMFAVVQHCSVAGAYVWPFAHSLQVNSTVSDPWPPDWLDLALNAQLKLTAPIKNIELFELSAKFNVNMFWTCCVFLFFLYLCLSVLYCTLLLTENSDIWWSRIDISAGNNLYIAYRSNWRTCCLLLFRTAAYPRGL